MIVRELDPPHREEHITIVLQALDIPWLREKGELAIHDRRIYVGDVLVAWIYSDTSREVHRAIGGEAARRWANEVRRRRKAGRAL